MINEEGEELKIENNLKTQNRSTYQIKQNKKSNRI